MAKHAIRNRRSARESMKRNRQRQHLVRGTFSALIAVVAIAGSTWFAIDRLGADSTSPSSGDLYTDIPVNDTVLGNPDAKAVLVEYGDYYCSHCADFALENEPQFIQDYVATGKLRYEFRPMPVLGGDLNDPANPSVRLAEASYAALGQGAYWPFHHAAFDATTAQRGARLTDEGIIGIARGIVPNSIASPPNSRAAPTASRSSTATTTA